MFNVGDASLAVTLLRRTLGLYTGDSDALALWVGGLFLPLFTLDSFPVESAGAI